LCIFYMLAWVPCVAAAESPAVVDAGNAYHIKADALTYDKVTQIYRARGNAFVSKGDQSLRADAVDFDDRTKDAKAWGDVRFFSGMDWLTGSQIEMNLEEGTGSVQNGTLFIEESHFYLRGDRIERTGKDSYFIKGAGRLTSCDDDWPAWEITGSDLRVTMEGYGTVKHAALRAKSIPVLYAPFVIFPAKIKRQTGLLIPLVSFSNTNGFEYYQPFFWAIDESSDATFYEHYMAHRGVKHGVEYRYVRSPGTKGTMMYDYLWDEQIDDGSDPAETSGYHYAGFRGDSENRINRKRWWFRTKADWELPADCAAMLDVDFVSDQDYLREFTSGYAGYSFSDHYFQKEFGRGLDEEEETVRLNQFNVNKSWDQYSLNATVQWYDNVIVRKNNLDDTTLQNLPAVSFYGSHQPNGDTSFYFDLSSSLNHFWREEGTRGYTMDASPRAYYPITVLKYFDFEPSVGVQETLWQAEEYDPPSSKKEDQLRSREIPDFEGDLSTEISRVFEVGGPGIDKIRHGIRPEVVYTYVPDVEQEDLPDFVESVEEESLVSYSVTNNFTSRRIEKGKRDKKAKPDKKVERDKKARLDAKGRRPPPAPVDRESDESGEIDENAPSRFVYHDFCRFSLSQDYDLLTARRPSESGAERQPFSDVEGRLELTPFYDVALDFLGNAAWSPYSGDYESYDAAMAFEDVRGDQVSAEYRYSRADSESVMGRLLVHLFYSLSAFWEHEYNLAEKEHVNSVFGFTYEPQCWAFSLTYTHDRSIGKREYFFEVSLYGLGKYELGQYRPDRGTDTWLKKG
jgi:LPS-assembly protein